MKDMMKFCELQVGDKFQWGMIRGIKLADNEDCDLPLDQQKYPNALILNSEHYSVVGPNTVVKRLRSRFDEKLKEDGAIESENKEPKLTEKNLERYGDTVLVREWKTLTGAYVTEKYIIWKKPNKRDQMYLLTMCNGEAITMKRV